MLQKFVKVQIDCDDDSESDNDSDVAPPPAPTPSTLKMQGTKLFAQGDYQGASEQFLKAIEMLQLSGGSLSTEQVADLVSCSNNRAACLLKLEKYDEARHDCDRVLKHSPQNHKALLRRGTTFEKTGQLESALQDFQSALSISPGLKEAVLGVERLSSLLKKQSASVSAEAKAEAIKQKDLGNAAFKQKQLDVALDHYGQSVSLDSQLFASFCNRALIYIRLGNFQEAINDCDKTLELDVDNAKALYRRGLALFELKEHKRALAMFEKLVSINPDNQQALGQIKKVKDILAKMPAPKMSEVKDVTPKISEVKDVTPISTSPTKDSSNSSSNTASSSSPKKAAPSPVKPLDTAKVAAAAKEKMKTKMAKGKKSAIPKTAYEFENYWRTLKSDPQAFYNVSDLIFDSVLYYLLTMCNRCTVCVLNFWSGVLRVFFLAVLQAAEATPDPEIVQRFYQRGHLVDDSHGCRKIYDQVSCSIL
jgi:tetratricopeptide (TPR) repeat protein